MPSASWAVLVTAIHALQRLTEESARGGFEANPHCERSAYSTGFHGIGISRYPVAVFSTWATEGNG
jgi:hypothetical protein